jgi:hypothetical protein
MESAECGVSNIREDNPTHKKETRKSILFMKISARIRGTLLNSMT